MEEVIGTVQSVIGKGKERILFLLPVEEEKKMIRIPLPPEIFLPLEKGDKIFASLQDGKLVGRPLVSPVQEEKNLESIFVRAIMQRPYSSAHYAKACGHIRRLFRALREANLDVVKTISSAADRYYRTQDNEEIKNIASYMPGVDVDSVSRLLLHWAKQWLFRRLYLLGVYRKTALEAFKYGYNLNSLYETLILYPFRVLMLSEEELTRILMTLPQKFDDVHRVLFRQLKNMHKRVIESALCSFPAHMYSFGPLQREILEKRFHCSFRKIEGSEYLLLDYQAQNISTIHSCLRKLLREQEPLHVLEKHKIGLDESQITGLERVAANNLALIDGEAGSGKSTLICNIVDLFLANGLSVHVLCFTGKAVARDEEILASRDVSVMTIHRFLATREGKIGAIIMDESGMTSTGLFSSLCAEIYKYDHARLVCIGDTNQLKSIEYGNIYQAMLESSCIPRVRLTINHRQVGEERVLVSFLHNVLEGKLSIIEGKDFRISFGSCGVETIKKMVGMYKQCGVKDDALTVIVPYNRLLADINAFFLDLYVPKENGITDDWSRTWYIGHRVMLTANCYDIGVMNGSEGKVVDVDRIRRVINVQFRKGIVEIPTTLEGEDAEEKDPFEGFMEEKREPVSTKLLIESWCVTVDKAQGSEWPYCILTLPDHQPGFICRERIYTASSRAKERLDIICDSSVLTLKSSVLFRSPRRYHIVERLEYGESTLDKEEEKDIEQATHEKDNLDKDGEKNPM